MIDDELLPPPHVDLQAANREIRYLQNEVLKYRRLYAELRVLRESERRRLRTELQGLQRLREQLRKQLRPPVDNNSGIK